MAVQSSHVLAAIATINVEQTRNAFIIQQLGSQQDYSRGRRRINMEIAAIFVLA